VTHYGVTAADIGTTIEVTRAALAETSPRVTTTDSLVTA
jgi:hypothetical protein